MNSASGGFQSRETVRELFQQTLKNSKEEYRFIAGRQTYILLLQICFYIFAITAARLMGSFGDDGPVSVLYPPCFRSVSAFRKWRLYLSAAVPEIRRMLCGCFPGRNAEVFISLCEQNANHDIIREILINHLQRSAVKFLHPGSLPSAVWQNSCSAGSGGCLSVFVKKRLLTALFGNACAQEEILPRISGIPETALLFAGAGLYSGAEDISVLN